MLLSESELRSALEPLLDRLLVERLRLFQLQLEPRLQQLIAAALAPRSPSGLAPALAELLRATDPNQVFEILFEFTPRLVGPARALLVVRNGEATVWNSHGLDLPARFPISDQAAILGAATRSIQVRGTIVGLFTWRAPMPPAEAAAEELDLLLEVTGRSLLHLAIAALKRAPVVAAAVPEAPAQLPALPVSLEGGNPAERFARLLIADLLLFLEHDQPDALARARGAGELVTRFQPEFERCRRAFFARFPDAEAVMEKIIDQYRNLSHGPGLEPLTR
ncbi:MAG TPA: hypothetical protein VIC32_01190 [Terriglobales bacterium]